LSMTKERLATSDGMAETRKACVRPTLPSIWRWVFPLALFLGRWHLRTNHFLWLSAVVAMMLLSAYNSSLEETPCLLYSAKLKSVVSNCQSLFKTMQYTPWALSGHVQATLFAVWPQMNRKCRASVQHKREMVRCIDGGQVALDWMLVGDDDGTAPDEATTHPIVLHLPGIVGKSGNAYLVRFAQHVQNHRWHNVVKSWRGIACPLAGKEPRPETWDRRAADDTIEVAEYLRRKYPHAPLLMIGWSHGGNVALAALAQQRATKLFEAGVMVSAPYDLQAAMNFLESEQWFPYTYINTKALVGEYDKVGARVSLAETLPNAAEKMSIIEGMLHWTKLASHLMIRRPYGSTWHQLVTTSYTGFEKVQDYYCSVRDMVQESLPRIKVPVLCLLAEDDPVTPPVTFRKFLAVGDDTSKLVFSVTKRGGHCGWFCGLLGYSWCDEAAAEFLHACMVQKVN